MRKIIERSAALLAACSLAVAVAVASEEPEPEPEPDLEPAAAAAVAAVERAFAATMADRDHEAFTRFLSDETVFISGPSILRGKEAVSAAWSGYFATPEAPFSWEPQTVEVLESGDLALSTGPVHAADGTLVATFTSIWRQEEPGVWRIVFDRGNRACSD